MQIRLLKHFAQEPAKPIIQDVSSMLTPLGTKTNLDEAAKRVAKEMADVKAPKISHQEPKGDYYGNGTYIIN